MTDLFIYFSDCGVAIRPKKGGRKKEKKGQRKYNSRGRQSLGEVCGVLTASCHQRASTCQGVWFSSGDILARPPAFLEPKTSSSSILVAIRLLPRTAGRNPTKQNDGHRNPTKGREKGRTCLYCGRRNPGKPGKTP